MDFYIHIENTTVKKYDVIRVFRFTLATAYVAQALGSSMENTAPRPGADRNPMRPPCYWTISLQIARPRSLSDLSLAG